MKLNKYKKHHKIKKIYKKHRNSLTVMNKGFYGLKVLESGVITPKQLETVRRVIARLTKRTSKIVINIFFNQPLTKKPLLTRMGKGSGSIDSWISYIKKGKIFIEIIGLNEKILVKLLKAVQAKINLKLELVKREIFDA